jgi:hypothetical protein
VEVVAGYHLPVSLYRDTCVTKGFLGFPLFVFPLLLAATIFTWLYNLTGGSLLLVIISIPCSTGCPCRKPSTHLRR